MCSEYSQLRGYSEVLLEEIALEGLDGITLSTLWKRLNVNPEWSMKPIDDFIEEFIWKHLISLSEVRWYSLPKSRANPLIFATSDDYLKAVENKEIDPSAVGLQFYEYNEIRNEEVIGSCADYDTRTEVTEELRSCTLSDAKNKWSDHLVAVANQEVRSYVLLSGDLHYELDFMPTTAYCILERIGRARRCGELSVSLNFIRNGANPTFYYWNRLRRRNLITSQNIYYSNKYASLFFLRIFHKDIGSLSTNVLVTIIKNIESSPKKACALMDLREIHPKINKLLKYNVYRECLRIEKVPYSQFYSDSTLKEQRTKNGNEKIVTIIKLADELKTSKTVPDCAIDDEDEEEDEVNGIFEESRLANKPLLMQCYHIVDGAGTSGISQLVVGRKLGTNKLMTRILLRTLLKINMIVRSGPEDAKTRFYTYYSKNFSYVKDLKLKKLNDVSETLMNSTIESSTETEVLLDTTTECNNIVEKEEKSNEKRGVKRKLSDVGDEEIKTDKSNEVSPTKNSTDNIIEVKQESLYTMRRMNIIMEHVYKNQVEHRMNLKEIIQKEENNQGFFQGDLDRRSLQKVIERLENCKKIKTITVNVTEPAFNKSKEIVFVCMPHITEDHPFIKSAVKQAKDNMSILYVKHAPKKKDTVNVKPLILIGKKDLSKYGQAPKFERMKVLHELLFYMLFSYQGDENLSPECYNSFIKSVCNDFEVDEKLPKCYVKEISWKMFIPPLMKYEEYRDGWVAQNDVVDRIPLRLLFMLIRPQYEIPHLQEYLSHPIKQHYLVDHLPDEMQKIVRVDKQYMCSVNYTFRLLATVGLIQYGPKLSYRGYANLIYVNRKATLLDTRTCPPSYSKINTEIKYPIHSYELNCLSDVETYWIDAMRFALKTNLGCTKLMKANTHDNERIPERLKELFNSCTIDEAPLRDTGKTPGDGHGALGYDSSLYAHLVRSWSFSKKRSGDTEMEKVESSSPKKSRLKEQISSKKSITKMKRFRFTAPKKTKMKKKSGTITYDKADEKALQNMRNFRVQWSKTEDDLLIMSYLAVLYSAEYLPGYRPVRLIRKLMHESCKKSLDKTALSCSRRIYRLLKDKINEHSVNVYFQELLQDSNLKDKYQAILNEVKEQLQDKEKSKVQYLTPTLDKLTEQIFRYLRDSTKAAEISSTGTYGNELPDDIESFNKLCRYEYPGTPNSDKSFLLQTDNDVPLLVIINLIFSSLFSQVDKNKKLNTNLIHHVFRNFDDNRLNKALSYVRGHRLISFNKCSERSRSSYLPIGQGVYHLSMTFHLLLKTLHSISVHSQIYARYLEMISHRDCGFIDINNYEAGLSLFLMSHFISDEVDFSVTIPENVLFFDSKPLTFIDPDEMAKPMLEAKSSFTDKTLSLIRETFFVDKEETENHMKEGSSKEKQKSLSESDSDTDLELDKNEEISNLANPNIALNLTRRQFKPTDVRFSNAYDHFLINLFPMKYKINNNSSRRFTSDTENTNLIKELEKEIVYRKLKYTVDEMFNKIQKHLSSSYERDFATSVLEFLRQRGLSGATNHTLKNQFDNLELLKKVTDALCTAKLILRSGSKFTHYVHVEFAASWLMPCQKNVELYIDESGKNEEMMVINRNKTEKMMKYNEGQIWLLIKPWVHANGSLNTEALNSLLIRIISYVLKYPCSSLEQIQNKFSPALQPHSTRELVEILERLKCIKLSSFETSDEVSLFSSPQIQSTISDVVTGFEDESSIIVEADVHAMVRLSIFLGSVDYKDLLETKYSTGIKMRVNGSCLTKYLNKQVCMIGTVHSLHQNNMGFNLTSTDNHNVTVKLDKPATDVSGLIEVWGTATGPSTINCDCYIIFPYSLASTYDAESDNEAVSLATLVANPWK